MSLSYYRVLAFDTAGEPCTGGLGHPDARHYLTIYKTWVEVGVELGLGASEQIAKIHHGRTYIRNFDVIAHQGHLGKRIDDPVFVFASIFIDANQYRWLAGVGAHADDTAWAVPAFWDWLTRLAAEETLAGRDMRAWVARCRDRGGDPQPQ